MITREPCTRVALGEYCDLHDTTEAHFADMAPLEREQCIVAGYCSVHQTSAKHYKDTGEVVPATALSDGDLGLAPDPPKPRALSPEALLRLGAWTLDEEQSDALERLLTDQRATYEAVLQEKGPQALIRALLERDRHLAQTGRQIADGRMAGRLLREFMRAALQKADHANLRQIGDATKTGKVEAILEAMGAEPADARQLKLHGSTLGPLTSPEERVEQLRKAGVIFQEAPGQEERK